MNVDLEQAIGFAVQVGVLIGLIAGAGVWVKRWIKSTVGDPVLEQVQPNGGSQDTTRHLIEQIQEGQDQIIERLDSHDEIGERNYSMAKQAFETSAEALGVARHTSERLDRWLAEQGGKL